MRLIVLFSILFFAVTACTKDKVEDPENIQGVETQYESTGSINGPDAGMCPCCGGWKLTIAGSQENYRIQNLHDFPNIDWNNLTLPIAVKLNWTMYSDCSGLTLITVDAIELD